MSGSIGFRDGWRGPLEDSFMELTIESTRGILPRGGTILGTSRTNPYKSPDGPANVKATLARDRVDLSLDMAAVAGVVDVERARPAGHPFEHAGAGVFDPFEAGDLAVGDHRAGGPFIEGPTERHDVMQGVQLRLQQPHGLPLGARTQIRPYEPKAW